MNSAIIRKASLQGWLWRRAYIEAERTPNKGQHPFPFSRWLGFWLGFASQTDKIALSNYYHSQLVITCPSPIFFCQNQLIRLEFFAQLSYFPFFFSNQEGKQPKKIKKSGMINIRKSFRIGKTMGKLGKSEKSEKKTNLIGCLPQVLSIISFHIK